MPNPRNMSCANIWAAICVVVPATFRSSPPLSMRRQNCGRATRMLDLGTSLLASVERDPDAVAIVDGSVRLSYAQWYRRISAVVAGFDELNLRTGDHVLTALQNRWEAATIHWACQFAGIICTPINWRSKASEIDYYVEDSLAKAVVFEDACTSEIRQSRAAASRPCIGLEGLQGSEVSF